MNIQSERYGAQFILHATPLLAALRKPLIERVCRVLLINPSN